MLATTVALYVCAQVATQPASGSPPRIAVLDLQATPGAEGLASAVAGVAANELQRLGAFTVSTSDQVRTLLSIERQKQLLGCPDDSCQSNLAGPLGADYLVTGKLTKLAGAKGQAPTLTLELNLIDAKAGKREASDVQTAPTETEVVARIAPSIAKLVSGILKARSGGLVVIASETGAVVKIDDVVVGTTPLAGKLQVPGGPHFLVVQKDGFITQQKEVRIRPDQVVEEHLSMIPSPDFIQSYESKQNKLRVGAWVVTGLAVAGIATASVFQWRAGQLYGSADTKNSFAYYRDQLNKGVEEEGGVNFRAKATAMKNEVQTAQLFSWISGGIGAAAAAGAAALWIVGDAPGKYTPYKELRPIAAFAPLPGGMAVALSGEF